MLNISVRLGINQGCRVLIVFCTRNGYVTVVRRFDLAVLKAAGGVVVRGAIAWSRIPLTAPHSSCHNYTCLDTNNGLAE